jgi:hypothetical protein
MNSLLALSASLRGVTYLFKYPDDPDEIHNFIQSINDD